MKTKSKVIKSTSAAKKNMRTTKPTTKKGIAKKY